jgi:DNA replication protein DnaC
MPNTINDVIKGAFVCRRCKKPLSFPGVCDPCYREIEVEKEKTDERNRKAHLDEINRNYSEFAAKAGIPPLYHHVNFMAFDKSDESGAMVYLGVGFAQNPQGFLFLHGDTGCGKTWLAVAIAHNMILEGRKVWFVRSLDLLNEVRRGINDNSSRDILDKYKKSAILILDDLGSEKLTDWVNEIVYDLIDYRHSHLKPTIITSNLKGEEIAKVFGSRIMSRIKAAGPIVDMGKIDRRIEPKGGSRE